MRPSLTTIFLSEKRSLMGSVMRIVRDPSTAEDLAQETYLRTRKALEAGPIDRIEAFLHHTARNLALDHERRRRTRERYERRDLEAQDFADIPAETPSPETIAIERERMRHLAEALEKLPERARRAWMLARVEGWPYPKIAEHLGVSQNTVFNDVKLAMGHCHDAMRRLGSL
ncbi:sigma-70 family RNA polymerase sigma factor [Mesorhizobium sp. YC-39]|uniref:RNA polymerase sigma factor n=1 Tax=unclassified Mesorhizobium TaxID=325217 RepID=UPI0021E7D99A|nr:MULTISPECIES: sigma-70 family RNA polymerase sigma factor [unclassified Mesorhizobium]MCV3208011.1 sigma-70 family RNA polymerase sigma factor [Mesorhizobium sp. YC-2]MCV3229738.1 sigma-70 family RNA polymerase sigma factor [Mesorhizobium sp. YC-39]